MNVAPLFTALFGSIFLKEQMTLLQIISLIITFAGIIMVVSGN
jgi:drug/metabolite transporter (DMT)-like permease